MESAAQPPAISVVIPCHNAAAYLPETVHSVIAQTRDDWEIVIVDDGSTDETAAVARELAGLSHPISVVSQPNAGAPAARNTGMRHVSQASRHLLFLDADDLLEPEMLDTVIRHLDEHRDVGMVHVGWTYVDETSRKVELDAPRLLPRWVPAGPWIRELRDDELETPFASIFCAAGMTPSMSVFRRAAFEQAGAWDEAFGEPAGDTDLSLRVALIAKVHFLSRPLVGYRIHATQMTSDRGRLGEQWRRLEALWSDCDHLPEAQRRRVEDAWRFKERAFVLRNGLHHVVRETRAGNIGRAVRYAGGAVRIALRSLLRGPPPRRR